VGSPPPSVRPANGAAAHGPPICPVQLAQEVRWSGPFCCAGRRVPAPAAVVPAVLGAAVLTLLWTWTAVSFSLGMRINGRPFASDSVLSFGDWKGLVAVVAYAPLLLWGPLLGAVTISCWQRHRG
jgi:hypothetical protein